MGKFAKLFESEKFGQILAMLSDCDDTGAPQIRFYCQPGSPLGLCHTGFTYADNDDGLERRAADFEKMSLEIAEAAASQVFKVAEGMRDSSTGELSA